MSINTPFTTVQIYLNQRAWRVWLIVGTAAILMIIGAVTVISWLMGVVHG